MKLPRPSAHRYESRFAKAVAWAMDITAALAVVAALWFGFWLFSVFKGLRPTDLSTLPPAKIFPKILNQPLPLGISDVQVAGHSSLSGTVWMKFGATDAAIKALLSSPKLEVEEPEAELQWAMPQQVLEDEKARAVGWEEVLQLRKIESHRFHFAPYRGSGWAGEIVVDRNKNVLYVHAGLL